MKYSVLVTNIDNLDAYEDRGLIQKLLISAVNFLNLLFQNEIQSEFKIGAFDIRGVFKNTYNSFLYYRLLLNLLYPLKIRSGFSFGNLKKLDEVMNNALEALDYCFDNDCQIILKTDSSEDKYLNMLFSTRSIINGEPSIPANLIQLFSDFLFPLIGDYQLLRRQDMIARLSLVLNFKSDLYEYLIDNPQISPRGINFERNSFPDIDYIKYGEYLDAYNLVQVGFSDDYQLLLNSFWKKGFSTKISEILGITRQIVDRNYRYLNFNISRNLDATIAFYLKSKDK